MIYSVHIRWRLSKCKAFLASYIARNSSRVLVKSVGKCWSFIVYVQANSFAKDIPAAAKIALLPAVSGTMLVRALCSIVYALCC